MKWFKGIFLPSLEERYNERSGKMWLTAKQVSVCIRYMAPDSGMRGLWKISDGGKTYTIQIAPNGCAKFSILVGGWIVQHT